MIAIVIRKNQKIRKSTLLHSLYSTQCLENLSLCNLNFFLCISITRMEPRIISRSRPSASTSKRTLVPFFQSWYTGKNSNYTWTNFPNTSLRQCMKERTICIQLHKGQRPYDHWKKILDWCRLCQFFTLCSWHWQSHDFRRKCVIMAINNL